MKLKDKILRKISTLYNDKVLKTEIRRETSENIIYTEIKNEKSLNYFEKPIFLISYDDISLMDGNFNTLDFGGKENGRVWLNFENFLKKYPYLKHTLFFVPNPIYLNTGFNNSFLMNNEFDIDKVSINNSLISNLVTLEKSNHVEIALHGYEHLQKNHSYYYPHFEFEFLKNEEAKNKIEMGNKSLSKYFNIKGFKPPAWGVGQLNDSYYLKDVLKELEFSYVSLSSPSNGLNYKEQKVSHIYPSNVDGLFNIPQNISILWDIEIIYKIIDEIISKKGIINIQFHFLDSHEVLPDGICDKNLKKLELIVDYIGDRVDYLLTKEVKEYVK